MDLTYVAINAGYGPAEAFDNVFRTYRGRGASGEATIRSEDLDVDPCAVQANEERYYACDVFRPTDPLQQSETG